MTIRELWRRVTTGRYVQALETEVSRLRAENRALLNSILGIAGVPPLTVAEVHSRATLFETDEKVGANSSSEPGMRGIQVAAPARRRSWQQIMRAWELEAARKKERPEPENTQPVVARKG